MRLIPIGFTLLSIFLLPACMHKGSNPADPYEPINREIHKFNMAFDATMLKPPAKLYQTILPTFIRTGINNFYDNLQMLPAIANDLLQGEGHDAIKDSQRFLLNSTLGLAGVVDVASGHFNLPVHHNDLGLTFAKWGNKKSPYIVIPLLGPSTIRDGMGMLFDYTLFTPFPYISNDAVLYGLLGLRYVDLRSQLFDVEPLMNEALDKYSFIRDAYLQHRNALISGAEADNGLADSMAQMKTDYIEEK